MKGVEVEGKKRERKRKKKRVECRNGSNSKLESPCSPCADLAEGRRTLAASAEEAIQGAPPTRSRTRRKRLIALGGLIVLFCFLVLFSSLL